MSTSGYKSQVNTFAINAGDTDSPDLHIGAATTVALFCPTTTSCQMYVRAAPTDTGSFYRVQNNTFNGDLTLNVGVGLNVFHLPERLSSVDHIKFESSVTQVNTTIFNYNVGW